MLIRRVGIFLAVATLITVLDLVTKAWADARLKPDDSTITCVGGYLDFKYNTNTGAAFGLLSDSKWGPTVLTLVSVAAGGFLVYLAFHIDERPVLMPISLGLVLGGVLGNLHDRIFNDGKVRDFIDAHVGNSHWPLFNIADSGITVGVILLVILSFFPGKKYASKKKQARPASA
ncbi:MAG: signal peptidase II [Planctomycetota bacterium]|nr:signal peptidase II [Planctomycetota bacterium]